MNQPPSHTPVCRLDRRNCRFRPRGFCKIRPMEYGELRGWGPYHAPNEIQVLTASGGDLIRGQFMLQRNVTESNASTQGVATFNILDLGSYSHYYIEITPWSTMPLFELPQSVSVYYDPANNPVIEQGDWYSLADPLGSASISPISSSWWTPNSVGGTNASVYLDITEQILSSQQIDWTWTVRVEISDDQAIPLSPDSLGRSVVLQTPVILGTNFAIPAPAVAPLFALAGLTARNRRRK